MILPFLLFRQQQPEAQKSFYALLHAWDKTTNLRNNNCKIRLLFRENYAEQKFIRSRVTRIKRLALSQCDIISIIKLNG